MKCLFLFPFLVLIASGQTPTPGSRTVLNNPVVQTDVDFKGHKLPNVFNQTPKEIWVSADRTDGKGLGTQLDPFDGSSSSKFDTVMASLSTNTTIHLGPTQSAPAPFQTNIATRTWRPLSGWKIRGAGMDVTTIQAIGSIPGGGYWSALGLDNGTDATGRSDGVEISDLTVDANASVIGASAPTANGEKNYKIGLITVMGNNNIVERVHAKGQYGSRANGNECFGIRLTGTLTQAGAEHDNIIRFCLVDGITGNFNDSYFISGSKGEVYGCRGFGANDGNGFSSTVKTALYSMVNAAYLSDSKVHDNIAQDACSLFHLDTGTASNIEVYNNKAIRSTTDGVGINNGTGHFIHDNEIQLQNRNGNLGNYALSLSGCTDLQIVRNKLTYAAGGNGTGAMFGVSVASSTGIFKDNIIDSHLNQNNLPSNFSVPFGTNKTEGGNLPLGLTESPSNSRNNSVLGSLRINITTSSTNPFAVWAVSPVSGGNYTIQSGDKLRCEVLSDIHNPLNAAAVTIMDGADEVGLTDQNGLFPYQDLPNASGRWLYREFDLTSKAANILTNIRIGLRPGGTVTIGSYTFYYRNVEVVDSNGVTKRTFISTDSAPSISDDTFTNISSHSFFIGQDRSYAITFANAPTPASEGMFQAFTDSTTATWGATITGGGTNHVLGYYDGTNWTVMGK